VSRTGRCIPTEAAWLCALEVFRLDDEAALGELLDGYLVGSLGERRPQLTDAVCELVSSLGLFELRPLIVCEPLHTGGSQLHLADHDDPGRTLCDLSGFEQIGYRSDWHFRFFLRCDDCRRLGTYPITDPKLFLEAGEPLWHPKLSGELLGVARSHLATTVRERLADGAEGLGSARKVGAGGLLAASEDELKRQGKAFGRLMRDAEDEALVWGARAALELCVKRLQGMETPDLWRALKAPEQADEELPRPSAPELRGLLSEILDDLEADLFSARERLGEHAAKLLERCRQRTGG